MATVRFLFVLRTSIFFWRATCSEGIGLWVVHCPGTPGSTLKSLAVGTFRSKGWVSKAILNMIKQ